MFTRRSIQLFALVAIVLLAVPTFAGAPKAKYSTPILSCGTSTTSTITINVTAGASGAPAGFSVQWMTADNYANFGWNENYMCKGSFSGQPGSSNYNLAPGETTTLEIGALQSAVGASFSCNDPLHCDTEYVFRAFAHATSAANRSDFTAAMTCSTAPCTPTGCTYTQGYWKNHSQSWPSFTGCGLTLGTNCYTMSQLLAIFGTPVQGNGLLSLAHQLIAAKLNVMSGASSDAVSLDIAAADAMIGSLVVGVDSLPTADTSALTAALDAYNNGVTGPGHCN